MQVGTIIKIHTPCLDNPAGTLGVCYEVYTIGSDAGFSFIFENGNYDGFSIDDMEIFRVEPIGICIEVSDYQFQNVMRLSEDFESGLFESAFIK